MKKQTFRDFAKKQITNYLVLMLVVIFIVFSILTYFLVNKQAEKNLQNENEGISKMLSNNFNYLEKEVARIELKKIPENKENELLLKEFYQMRTDSELKFNFAFLKDDKIIASNLYDENINYLIEGENLSEARGYLSKYNEVYIKTSKNNYPKAQEATIFLMKNFRDGFLIIEILEESFESLKGSYRTNLLISDKFDNIIYQDNTYFRDKVGKVTSNVKNHISYTREINFFGNNLIIWNFQDMSFSYQLLIIGYTIIIFIFIGMIVTIPLISRKIAKSMNDPLLHLLDVIETNQKGKLDYEANLTSLYEFNVLIKKYNQLLNSIQSLIQSNRELAEREKWMEIKILQGQFNPHFIYNTLESIRYEILLNPKNASDMIVKLSQLMRYSIKNPSKTVYLYEDIKYIEDYLTLQKMRFGQRLEYEIQLNEALLEIKIPQLLLQPLIENSIKYNMDTVDYLNIIIRGESLPSVYRIVIEDNGLGMSEERLNELNNQFNDQKIINKNYGLFNVHRSIQLLYGEEYGIKEIKSDDGLKIKIYLPKEDLNV